MKLKTSTVQAIERAVPVKDSKDLELLGTESLSISPDYKRLLDANRISSSQNSFLSLFGIDTKFFYSVKFECTQHGFTERGLGYIYENEGKFFLKRFRPFYIIENNSVIPAHTPRPIVCSEDHNDYITASSYVPSTFTEVLTEPHSIITCEQTHLPTSVVLQENSVLGRNKDGIESIPIENLINDTLQLNPRPSAPERKGTLYYDENDDCLKYYDGEGWRILVWQQD